MSEHLDYEINKELGECYLFMGELDKAEEYYHKAAKSNGIHPDPYMGLATVAVQRGDLESALAMYNKAHGIEATDKTHAGIGLILMEQAGKDEAFDHFASALSLNGANMVALFSLVRLGHELERLPEIVPYLENALDIEGDKSEVRYALAGSLICMERKDEAREHLERILAADPDNGPAKELLAQIQD